VQFQRGIRGGVCEIGIHHGKLFLLMNAVTAPDEPSFAVDLFDQDSLNISHSGHGSAEIFRSNLDKFDAKKGNNVTLIAGDSTAAETQREMEKLIPRGGIRMFSVDGGHTAEHTISAIALAMAKPGIMPTRS
jgi:hypothetical protein